jgi:hypothetical protein
MKLVTLQNMNYEAMRILAEIGQLQGAHSGYPKSDFDIQRFNIYIYEFLLSKSHRDKFTLATIFVHHISQELQLLMVKMEIRGLEAVYL